MDPCCEKDIFVSYDKQSPAYLIYFPGTTAIKRVKCVKFIDFDNSSLSKPDKNTEYPDSLITWCRTERQKYWRGGANNPLSHLTEDKTQFFCRWKLWIWWGWLLLYSAYDSC